MKYAVCHPERALYCKGVCKPCYMLAWRAANPRPYTEADRDRVLAWGNANPEAQRLHMQKWRRKARTENPERFRDSERANRQRRRASCKANTPHPATPAQRAALVAPGETCLYCEAAQAVHVDHFIPIARWAEVQLTARQRADGPDHISNLVGACAACNLAKNDRLPDVEWRGRGVDP